MIKESEVTTTDCQCPAGISKSTVDRFRQLQKRREDQCRGARHRRINKLISETASRVSEQFQNDDEIEALRHDNVDLTTLTQLDRQQRTAFNKDKDVKVEPAAEQNNSREEGEWSEVRQYLNVNQHLSEETGGSEAPKSGLEKAVIRAIEAGELELAEELSDRLADRQLGTKIAAAFDAKRFLEKRKREEDARKAAKKKRLAWGFELKNRWETKGNM